jgi:hypothetical protein
VKLSGTFKTSGGETWSIVAMQATGSDLAADDIRRANPQASEPLKPGLTLKIPIDARASSSQYPKDLEIKVWGEKIATFDDFELQSAIDAIQKGAFCVPNEQIFRDMFIPFSTPSITVSANYELLLTGRCYSPIVSDKNLNIQFYSEPAILETSGPPIEAFPLEFKKQNLQQIAAELCWKHGIEVEFDDDAGGWFKEVSIEPGSNTLEFLADLARQRGFVIKDTPEGRLLFHSGSTSGGPVSNLEAGFHPLESVNPSFEESQYYNSVTGYIPHKSGRGYTGVGITVDNPYKTDVVRALCQEFPDIDKGELEASTQSLAGRMFAGAVRYDIELSTWTDDNGNLYKPRTRLKLKSPEHFIVKPYEFTVASVALRRSSSGGTVSSLSLVLPGVYSGQIPEAMPWQ